MQRMNNNTDIIVNLTLPPASCTTMRYIISALPFPPRIPGSIRATMATTAITLIRSALS